MIPTEHKPLFDSIVLAAAELSVIAHGRTLEESQAEANKLLTEWWTPNLVPNLSKRAVKPELIRSIVIHSFEK